MIKVGLSGSRYSGKNRTIKVFKQIGVPVFEVDVILKFILNYNEELIDLIKVKIGGQYFTKDELDFKKIKDKDVFDKVLKVVEYDLFKAYNKFIEKNDKAIYTIFHSSILFESNWYKKMDLNITVFSPKTDRIKRCKYKTNNGLMLINDLAKTEMDSLDKNVLADYTIHNYNDVSISFGDILKQVDTIDMKIIDKYLINENSKKLSTFPVAMNIF
jgi:dephospho-CoA kinase